MRGRCEVDASRLFGGVAHTGTDDGERDSRIARNRSPGVPGTVGTEWKVRPDQAAQFPQQNIVPHQCSRVLRECLFRLS